MRSKVAKRILEKTPEDTKVFVSWYAALVVKINQSLEDKGMTQNDLAKKLGKHPSEIHRWINGDHNFTLRSLAKIQAELGVTLLEIPDQVREERSIKNVENKEWKVLKRTSIQQKVKVITQPSVKTKYIHATAETDYSYAG
jgi:transcriptional regulator with XRE-family HTH domain